MAGCFGGGEEKETVSAVADGGLTVGIVNGGDIFASKEGDTYSGIEPMLVNALGDALDVTVEYVEVSGTQELLQLLDAGTVDAAIGRIARMTRTARGICPREITAKRAFIWSPEGMTTRTRWQAFPR